MSKKSLKETNPYLKDPKKYEAALITNVVTSSAVESIHITPEQLFKKINWGIHLTDVTPRCNT